MLFLYYLHCKKSVLKIQEYIHEGANLKFYIPEFFNFRLLIPDYSPIYRFWFQTAAYFFYSVTWDILSFVARFPSNDYFKIYFSFTTGTQNFLFYLFHQNFNKNKKSTLWS
jgi:hypothetical protein